MCAGLDSASRQDQTAVSSGYPQLKVDGLLVSFYREGERGVVSNRLHWEYGYVFNVAGERVNGYRCFDPTPGSANSNGHFNPNEQGN